MSVDEMRPEGTVWPGAQAASPPPVTTGIRNGRFPLLAAEVAIGRGRPLLSLFLMAWLVAEPGSSAEPSRPAQISGIYPHLAMFNDENECGTGAVVPWAERLWVVTYAPHKPKGSTDKLYEITPDLEQITRPESVGGTPANRFIHRESNQLLIGPYLVDASRRVRVIRPDRMPGRLTGTARHLTSPETRVYYATMEEGFYEVDVQSLEVKVLYPDANGLPNPAGDLLPGYHGKGFYSGQGRVVYANNGEFSQDAQRHPEIASGCLAEWKGKAWQVVRRNQFTEVTGPGGIGGNSDPVNDPLWSIGWDFRSLILMVLDNGRWCSYRLPKTSHCYDGAHGWNTEWPRIRDIGEDDLLMTMHGSFWRFPRTFSALHSKGLVPRTTYLKVIGDFCRWNDQLVFGCDDTARSEFLNRRKAKGELAGPGRSQSNLWFTEPDRPDQLGPALGRGAVWLRDPVEINQASDAFLFAGYAFRQLYLTHTHPETLTFAIEVDRKGNGTWDTLRSVDVPARGSSWMVFPKEESAAWIRLRAAQAATNVTAVFHYRGMDTREPRATRVFDGLAGTHEADFTDGLLHTGGGIAPRLRFLARNASGELGTYELTSELTLEPANDAGLANWMRQNVAMPRGVLAIDEASVLYVDERGRWRLPKGDSSIDQSGPLGDYRVCREVCTERDLFNAEGTFYELPAENAGGFARIRPITTHNRRIHDFASYRGLLVMSGVATNAPADNPHLVRSRDGRCALWVGAVDDLWQLGKPRGFGGPWKNTAVQPGRPSDPYLMTGYDRKALRLSHSAASEVKIRVEMDISGDGLWVHYQTFVVPSGQTIEHRLLDACSAYWTRVVADTDCVATAQFTYD